MSTLPNSERIGKAWRLHRDGNNSDAIGAFEEIIAISPESVDAHYGLGLVNKALGDSASAAAAFQQALDKVQEALSAIQTASSAEGHHGANDLDTNYDDRYMMLTRMITQRLDELAAASA